MGNTAYGPPEVAALPQPDEWCVWIKDRHSEKGSSKTYSTLGQAKSALTASVRYSDPSHRHSIVFRWVGGGWVQYAEVPAGTPKQDHDLWKKKPTKASVKQVEQAIASINGEAVKRTKAEERAIASILKAAR